LADRKKDLKSGSEKFTRSSKAITGNQIRGLTLSRFPGYFTSAKFLMVLEIVEPINLTPEVSAMTL
jgi:hypothetical protein